MPASNSLLAATFLILTAIFPFVTTTDQLQPKTSPTRQSQVQTSAVSSALQWLVSHQLRDGSYGDFHEQQTAAAAYALWLNNSSSASSRLSYTNITGQLDSASSWFWPPYGESDYPGVLLYTVAATQQLNLLHDSTGVYDRLLQFQLPTGGFEGYFDTSLMHTVTSSVDTAEALWGLINAGRIQTTNLTAGISYLLSLQNNDGSFNLTNRMRSDPIYSLGPDSASITALVTLVLRDASFSINNPRIMKALDFLSKAVSENLGGPGHPYAAALSSLAFVSYYRLEDASGALACLRAQQNPDGSFNDISRSSGPNALDTGWAAIALQVGSLSTHLEQIDHAPVAKFIFSPQSVVENTGVSFTARDSYDPDGDDLSYSWTFGDGSSALGVNPVHVYTRPGNFSITLTAKETGTAQALSDTTWQALYVQPAPLQASPAPSPSAIFLAVVPLAIVLILLTVTFFLVRRRRASRG